MASLLRKSGRFLIRPHRVKLIGSSSTRERGIASLSLLRYTLNYSDCSNASADTIIINTQKHGHYYRSIDSPAIITRRRIHHHTSVPSKLCKDASTALQLSGLKTGDTIAVGGFGLGGIPETLLNTLAAWDDGPTNLTVASLTAGGKYYCCHISYSWWSIIIISFAHIIVTLLLSGWVRSWQIIRMWQSKADDKQLRRWE